MPIGTGESKQVIGKYCIANETIGRCPVHKEFAIDVEKESLIKALAANIGSEFQGVVASNFSEAIRPLKRIANLRQFPLAVIADRESAAHLNERNSLSCGAQPRMDAQAVRWRAVPEARHRSQHIGEPRWSWWTGILQ